MTYTGALPVGPLALRVSGTGAYTLGVELACPTRRRRRLCRSLWALPLRRPWQPIGLMRSRWSGPCY